MKITSLAKNVTVVEKKNGTLILISYSTPVAAFVPGEGYLKTSLFHSGTTSRHVNKWTENRADEKPQDFFNNLLEA